MSVHVPAESSFDETFGYPSGCVGGGPVHLGVVLAGEGATAVSAPTAICVDNDLPAGQTGVSHGATCTKESRLKKGLGEGCEIFIYFVD